MLKEKFPPVTLNIFTNGSKFLPLQVVIFQVLTLEN